MVLTGADAVDWEAALPLQRPRLVRYCARLTGDADAAEDLAQETLYEAWRCLAKLRDPAGLDRWLAAIARNVCLRWGRRRGRELRRRAPPGAAEESGLSPAEEGFAEEALADDLDLEGELERGELLALLDRALAALPPETRRVLVQRYVEEAPQAEIARRLGVREGAIEARLQRGKRALRAALTTRFAPEAAAYGLVDAAGGGWRPTPIWCPGCGRRRLEGDFRPDAGVLRLRCPDCPVAGAGHYLNARLGDGLRGLRTFRPALTRAQTLIHDLFQVAPVDGAVRCPGCGDWLPIVREAAAPIAASWVWAESIVVRCRRCRLVDDYESWHSLTWSLPEVRRFWRAHPRMRFLPAREVEVDGRPAVVTGFASLTDAARIEAVLRRADGRVLRVDGAPREEGA